MTAPVRMGAMSGLWRREPLPYGIGFFARSVRRSNGKQEGEISPVMKSASGRYLVFYLNKAVPSEIPPL